MDQWIDALTKIIVGVKRGHQWLDCMRPLDRTGRPSHCGQARAQQRLYFFS
jgi:hypothetical protein